MGAATFLETFAGLLDGADILAHCAREHSADAYRRYLGRGARAWLAELDPGDAPVGYALLSAPELHGAAQDGSDLELKRIYALSRFHGAGLGAALLAAASEAARGAGARRLLLGVYAGNARALAFYRKSSFTEIGARRFRVGSTEHHDLVLALSLE